jgi:hypothetical protein
MKQRFVRQTPYAIDNLASKQRKMARPRDLLAWFLTGFREEVPDRLHSRGVWRDARYRGDVDAYAPVGGSALGSPRMADPFRAFIEDDPFGTEPSEYEGHKSIRNHYRTPMRAALARLAGRGADHDPYPFMARALYRTAQRDGDWDGACASLGIIEPVRKPYIEAALHRLYDRYHEEPPVNTVRTQREDVAA